MPNSPTSSKASSVKTSTSAQSLHRIISKIQSTASLARRSSTTSSWKGDAESPKLPPPVMIIVVEMFFAMREEDMAMREEMIEANDRGGLWAGGAFKNRPKRRSFYQPRPLMLTNRFLCAISTPLLYRDVHLHGWHQTSSFLQIASIHSYKHLRSLSSTTAYPGEMIFDHASKINKLVYEVAQRFHREEDMKAMETLELHPTGAVLRLPAGTILTSALAVPLCFSRIEMAAETLLDPRFFDSTYFPNTSISTYFRRAPPNPFAYPPIHIKFTQPNCQALEAVCELKKHLNVDLQIDVEIGGEASGFTEWTARGTVTPAPDGVGFEHKTGMEWLKAVCEAPAKDGMEGRFKVVVTDGGLLSESHMFCGVEETWSPHLDLAKACKKDAKCPYSKKIRDLGLIACLTPGKRDLPETILLWRSHLGLT